MMRNIDMIPALYLGDRTEEMMETYSSALISLAHNGTPESPLTGAWKPYTREEPACMCFGQKIAMLQKDDTEFVRLMEKYPSKRK